MLCFLGSEIPIHENKEDHSSFCFQNGTEISKIFFQEVYNCEGEYLYVDGRIDNQGVSTTRGRG